MQSFNYGSSFGPFSPFEYFLQNDPVYVVDSASGVIPVLLGISTDFSLHPADILVSGTVSGLRGALAPESSIGGFELHRVSYSIHLTRLDLFSTRILMGLGAFRYREMACLTERPMLEQMVALSRRPAPPSKPPVGEISRNRVFWRFSVSA